MANSVQTLPHFPIQIWAEIQQRFKSLKYITDPKTNLKVYS
jgi:hypothetical protein